MIIRADLDAAQGAAIRHEALKAGISPNELARRIIAKHLYALAVDDMNPEHQPKQFVGEDWL